MEQITQLQQQQAIFTQALRAAVEGKWIGEASVEAFLYSLDPTMMGSITSDPPITQSDVDQLPKA